MDDDYSMMLPHPLQLQLKKFLVPFLIFKDYRDKKKTLCCRGSRSQDPLKLLLMYQFHRRAAIASGHEMCAAAITSDVPVQGPYRTPPSIVFDPRDSFAESRNVSARGGVLLMSSATLSTKLKSWW